MQLYNCYKNFKTGRIYAVVVNDLFFIIFLWVERDRMSLKEVLSTNKVKALSFSMNSLSFLKR